MKRHRGRAPMGNWQPQINLDLATNSTLIQGDLREVVLTVTVSAKQNDKTLFLVEVKQAGAFVMQHLSDEDTKRAIASICPGVLFPYARAMVSQLVAQGWLPAAAAAASELRRAVPQRAGADGAACLAAQELTR